jgi:hypothetical protein
MGEKGATNEVINRFLVSLHDAKDEVRRSACEALKIMGEKAATNEVINRLLILLHDAKDEVRRSACEAIKIMGEKAATNEVINRLLVLLHDVKDQVRRSACEALGKIGEKAVTNEVIRALLDVYIHRGDKLGLSLDFAMKNIFGLLPCLSALEDNTVRKLSEYISEGNSRCLRNISPEEFIKAFLNTKISFWLPIIRSVFVRQGYAITITGMTIAVHGRKEAVPVPFLSSEVGEELQEYFVNWLDNPSQRCGRVVKQIIAIKSACLDDSYD